MNYADYDTIIVAFSGGKDSTACFLHLLDQGVDMTKVELMHHLIDGKSDNYMDWKVTDDYCQQFADAFNVPIYFSWREGGFRGEMFKENSRSKPVVFETPSGEVMSIPVKTGELGTRLQFPQVGNNLKTRWCSAQLKIEVCRRLLTNDPRFRNQKTLLITGERAEESSGRAKYNELERHHSDLRNGKSFTRHIDHYRPIHKWTEQEVWELLEKYRVNPHPSYRLGFGRCSCAGCIFGNEDMYATLMAINPDQFDRLATDEEGFEKTIKRTGEPLRSYASKGTPYEMEKEALRFVDTKDYNDHIILPEGINWELPSGAYGESCGAT